MTAVADAIGNRIGAIATLEVIECGALRIAKIVQDGGGSAGCQWTGFQAAAIERE